RGETSLEDILASVIVNMANKGASLIKQSQVNPASVLVIGGLTLNRVVSQKLKKALPDVTVALHPFSHVFEAYGTALLAKDTPKHRNPQIIMKKTFTSLPNLKQFESLVKIMPDKSSQTGKIDSTISYILGVDVGSTTTKAVLIHPQTHQILASHYGRTSGNPIEATRMCLSKIIEQVGSVKIHLVGVTGSGRQMVGAYLGTSAVFNEISAHSEGAAYFDAEVDTIFEIGGQDAKYMFLDNGVPIDYAMNASCSAGTGSFLEESAKCDLGITVYDIADIALNSPKAVRFKADCAAFINSDIRTALQEGYSKPEIVGGLVYSIVTNYLNKVKGSRPIGKKIFFQGGVAKNHAIGYAFAQATGREIIIPPFPELMGAFGIALITQIKFDQGEISVMPESTSLEQLISPVLKHVGHFTCKSCQNYCRIERYAVGDRKFPFGGQCTKYEHLWRKSVQITEQEDLVAYRAELMYPTPDLKEEKDFNLGKQKIGIPKALMTHSLYPMYYTFLRELGFEVVLSGIDPDFEMIPNAPICYPMQLYHGAVADLVKQGIDLIFLPHILELKRSNKEVRASFCPVTQTGSYMVAPIFPSAEFLIPELDFSLGYRNNSTLIEMATTKLHFDEEWATDAYIKAVDHQKSVEEQLKSKGAEVLAEVIKSGETAIIVVGRSYNVFPRETSQSMPKKLISMGVRVIPFDFLDPEGKSEFPWYFANYVEKAVEIVKTHDNIFLLYINSFSCTIDAFLQNFVRTRMLAKPYLLMELDAHMADAGTQTRLEAFLEIIKNYRANHQDPVTGKFRKADVEMVEGKAMVVSSSGEYLDILDPRVKIHLFPFSPYHTDVMEGYLKVLGYNVESTGDVQLEYATEGLKYTSGKECIPLPIVLGHILHIVKNRKPGEVIGYFILRGGEPCVVCSYVNYMEDFLQKNHITDVFLFKFDRYNDFMGSKFADIVNYGPKTLILADIIHDIDSALHVVGKIDSLSLLKQYWQEFLVEFREFSAFKSGMDKLVDKIATIPRKGSPLDYPKVILSGDFYVRFSPFFLHELRKLYTEQGIIVKSTDLFELFAYGVPFGSIVNPLQRDTYVQKRVAKIKGEDRIWKDFSTGYYASQLIYKIIESTDHKFRKRFEKTGLLYAPANDIIEIIKKAYPHMSPRIFGEGILTVGKGLEVLEDGAFDAIILIGPQFCLPYHTSQ
ncbi:MAG: acyl-CoA dehydratase activase-related protein, partial [Promethearchaeota archaeon]